MAIETESTELFNSIPKTVDERLPENGNCFCNHIVQFPNKIVSFFKDCMSFIESSLNDPEVVAHLVAATIAATIVALIVLIFLIRRRYSRKNEYQLQADRLKIDDLDTISICTTKSYISDDNSPVFKKKNTHTIVVFEKPCQTGANCVENKNCSEYTHL